MLLQNVAFRLNKRCGRTSAYLTSSRCSCCRRQAGAGATHACSHVSLTQRVAYTVRNCYEQMQKRSSGCSWHVQGNPAGRTWRLLTTGCAHARIMNSEGEAVNALAQYAEEQGAGAPAMGGYVGCSSGEKMFRAPACEPSTKSSTAAASTTSPAGPSIAVTRNSALPQSSVAQPGSQKCSSLSVTVYPQLLASRQITLRTPSLLFRVEQPVRRTGSSSVCLNTP